MGGSGPFTDPFTATAIATPVLPPFHVVGNASEMVSKHVYGRSQLGALHSTWCEQASPIQVWVTYVEPSIMVR